MHALEATTSSETRGSSGHATEDTNIALRVAGGDPRAAAALYQRHARRLQRIAFRALRSAEDAEDTVHDAFVSFLARPVTFVPERGEFAPWLRTNVHNLALDRFRARVRHARIHRQRLDHELTGRSAAREAAEFEIDREGLERALQTITPSHRTLLVDAFERGLTYTEIAARHGLPLGTVKSRIQRALRRMQATLAAGTLEDAAA